MLVIQIPDFGLNRHDTSSVSAYAADVKRAESLGWDAAFLPDSQLRRRDTYVLLAAAANCTGSIKIGPLLANPVTRHPTVTASSISTIGELAPGRTLLTLGIGDTAVRLAGLSPATVEQLKRSVITIRTLLSGSPVDVGAERPAILPFASEVPVWIAAGGPKTLQMAGSFADGVFIRVGTDIRNIKLSVDKIRQGAASCGRDPSSVRLGAVFHTVFVDDSEEALLMGKSMAAGYFEYSPMLMENLGMDWGGASPSQIKEKYGVWPDFHHSEDLVASGTAVNFLSDEQALAFSLLGDAKMIISQIVGLIKEASELSIDFDYIVLHPIPNPRYPDLGSESYMERVPVEIIDDVKKALSKF